MRLVTIKEVSEYLAVKISTIYSWVHHGAIPFHKLNGLIRFEMAEIETWVRASSKESQNSIVPTNKGTKTDIDGIIKKAIDSVKGKGYNPSNGKPGQMQGLRKEA